MVTGRRYRRTHPFASGAARGATSANVQQAPSVEPMGRRGRPAYAARPVHWCDGSEEENRELIRDDGARRHADPAERRNVPELLAASLESDGCRAHRAPDLRLHRRTRTTPARTTTGWIRPRRTRKSVRCSPARCAAARCTSCRTCMGPVDSPYQPRCGVEITDSPVRRRQHAHHDAHGRAGLARIDREGLEQRSRRADFVKGLHSLGDLDPGAALHHAFSRRARRSESIGSGYGGNALLGKKCFALRIASCRRATKAGSPSTCSSSASRSRRRNALRRRGVSQRVRQDQSRDADSAESYRKRLEGLDRRRRHRLDARRGRRPPVGDQSRGRLSSASRRARARRRTRTRWRRSKHDAIFTNVALSPTDNQPWWEGIDGRRRPVTSTGRADAHDAENGPAAHPNSRFTVAAKQCPSCRRAPKIRKACRSPRSSSADVVPTLVPLVFEALDWKHGVFVGASMASETTAAATGAVGVSAPRPDGDAAVLRLQHGRLLRALALVRQAAREAAEDLPRQLVPQRRGRQVPLAGLRREPARARMDHRPLRRRCAGRRNTDRLRAAQTRSPRRRATTRRSRARCATGC